MAAVRRFLLRLSGVFRSGRAERELARELEAHRALVEDEMTRRGLPPSEARRQARLALGGPEQVKELHRDARAFVLLDDLKRDVRYALRSLARTPGFTFVAVLTLALGIGANTAIFSVIQPVLLHPLPFKDPGRLVTVYENVPAAESRNGRALRQGGLESREFLALASGSHTLSHVTANSTSLASVVGAAEDVECEVSRVTSATLPMLGAQPILGRWFSADDEVAGQDDVLILSYRAWQRYFAGNPNALGKTIAFNGNTFSRGLALGTDFTVIGVMPKDFHFPDDNTQFWTPMIVAPPADARRRQQVSMMARLADGVSVEAATSELSAIVRAARVASSNAPTPAPGTSWDRPDGEHPRFELVRSEDEISAGVKPALLVLAGAVGFVLLIACANVANLLLARTAAREREIAVRLAIGAGRMRLVRQMLTESVILSLIGGAAGVALAAGGVRLFRALATSMARVDLGPINTAIPRLDAIGINAEVLAFVAALSLATGMLFGVLPAFRGARNVHLDVLRGASGTTSARGFRGRFALQNTLVVAELALATVLAIGGGLLIHSFAKLARIDTGYDAANVLTFQASLPGAVRPSAELKMFADDLVARLRKTPGIEAAAYANQLPLVKLQNTMRVSRTSGVQARGVPLAPDVGADAQLVSGDYLRVMGVKLLAGRTFGDGDTAGRPPVLLINRALAARDFPDRSPVGESVFVGGGKSPWLVIGVIENLRIHDLDRDPVPQIFLTVDQWSSDAGLPIFPAGAYYAIRTSMPPAVATAGVHRLLQQVDRKASLENIATMEDIVSNEMARPRMYAVLLGIFAGIAVLLAAAGIYGVMAYAVAQRTREIGIRMALGAQRGEVLSLVLKQSTALTFIGTAIGLAGAAATTKYLQSLLFGLTALDVTTFAAVAGFFVLVATLASYVPARRATKVDPLIALRSE